MITFKGNYNKEEFYAMMGKFFAEEEYRKKMPLLLNHKNSVWHIELINNKVIGFITYTLENRHAYISYRYVDKNYENKDLLEKTLIEKIIDECKDKDIFIKIDNLKEYKEPYEKFGFLVCGFEEYRYYTLVKRASLQ